MNVLLVAEESAGIQVLRALDRHAHHLVAVMTAPPTRGGGATVAALAETLGVPILPSPDVREPDLAAWVRDQGVDLLLNVHSLYVIHGAVVAAPRIGSFNLHPGPLPQYAGLNAPSWAIFHGEGRHAVTLHWMEPGIDTGPIVDSAWFEVAEDETGLSLSAKCVRAGVPLVERLLELAVHGRDAIPAIPQDLSRRRYFGRADVPHGGAISWSRTAREIVALVRAADFAPFPSPWGRIRARSNGTLVAVTKASRTGEATTAGAGTVAAAAGEAVRVAASDEWVLVQRVEVDGVALPAAGVLREGTVIDDG
jgi:UDP-4-amino-4-deoxy-L-arabinose formyltransferase/UDP-glucuronic acid dehydrogenase (UDP-4-keto-hexauronic acid decarboxylating)